jgi:hypothetical protein
MVGIFLPFLPVYNFDADINISILYHHIAEWRRDVALPPILNIQVSYDIIIFLLGVLYSENSMFLFTFRVIIVQVRTKILFCLGFSLF